MRLGLRPKGNFRPDLPARSATITPQKAADRPANGAHPKARHPAFSSTKPNLFQDGAGDRGRTDDVQLGKLAFYR